MKATTVAATVVEFTFAHPVGWDAASKTISLSGHLDRDGILAALADNYEHVHIRSIEHV